MKVILLWAVAAWVVAVTADRPCAEYCVYLSSGTRNIEFQPGCDCMYEKPEFQDRFVDSRIYHEPVDYMPLPAYIHEQPFYILNPLSHGRQSYSADNNPVMRGNVQPSLNSRTYNTEIEHNIEDTHSSHNRQEKDLQTNNQRINAPLYLDINVESEDVERSAITEVITTEDLKQTEQSLMECADLYAVIHSRKSTEMKNIDTIRPKHFTDTEIIEMIQNKCSHISYVVENSLNEIKKTRFRLPNVKFKIDNKDQQNKERSHPNDSIKENQCADPTEKILQSTVHSEDSEEKIEEHDVNQEQTTILGSDYAESTSEIFNVLPSKVSSTTKSFQFVPDIYTKKENISEVVTSNTNKQNQVDPIYTENEYPFDKKTLIKKLLPITVISESTTPGVILDSTTNTLKPVLKNHSSDQEYRPKNIKELYENRPQYKESEVLPIKIITQEFNNNTVQSFINGTEDIPNGDFPDEKEHTEVDHKTEDSTNISPRYNYTITTPVEFETSTPNIEDHGITAPDISGNLYFIFNNHQIPAKFVQKLNGSLNLGIDGITLCNTLTQNAERSSLLLTTLCKCYKSGNCTQK